MTTIVGIEASKGKKGVVLASDVMATVTNGAKFERRDFQKIYIANDQRMAYAGAGIVDEFYNSFVYGMKSGEIDTFNAIKKGMCVELRDIHLQRFGGRIVDPSKQNGFLIATRHEFEGDKNATPRLFTLFPLGKIEGRFYTSIGSGSDHALEYLAKQNPLSPNDLSIVDALELAEESINVASRDIHTSGLNLVVVTEDRVIDYAKIISEEMRNTRAALLQRMKKDFE